MNDNKPEKQFLSEQRALIKNKKRWVVKIGSALLTNNGEGLNVDFIASIAEQIVFLRKQGVEVLLVSSGSVAAGVSQLNLPERPSKVNELQAAAAVGQASLVRHYEDVFKPYGVSIAQILLTNADIANRERYLNAKATLNTLLSLDVLTVINENDTVATDEICFGDNDNLAALVANLVGASLLVILTDQDGLYTADPRKDANASLVRECVAEDKSLLTMASGGGKLGRGGMVTKLLAAQTASHSGASTIIANGSLEQVLEKVFLGNEVGTFLYANEQRLASKKQWMIGQVKVNGQITVDSGAASVLQESGRSLLPIGVTKVEGNFKRGELVQCLDEQGFEIARGLINYNDVDASKIVGVASSQIGEILGYGGEDELIHRDNLVLV